MTAIASRAYAHRSRNGFLIALWVAKNNPNAFGSADKHAQKIIITMLTAQADQKLGRRPKFQGMIQSAEAALLWSIQNAKPAEQKRLVMETCSSGLALVAQGFVSILPDDELQGWRLVLSPEGEELVLQLNLAQQQKS